ncbi:GCN5 family acetyltransferase [Prauserella marina]|uniref:Acetyltransferase (GNAT) family protein n=1 Tax=Prauserella marina TaxID=530584 RepID=A0A222VV92_9PSEU|nr:GNAT family N-acetyltransferase [Prauserella marina]ASR37866.1 GCN5 family acetyltransferase [Prauserella marina]PWV73065.1 acetyltransferase (GNAT) family protein [Prauserella marina]SDD72766.1 Acetyltransferase (GNAT) family protein [Prauserella marina]
MTDISLRKGSQDDADLILRFFDEAVAWLTARGSEGQWGSTPWSRIPQRVERVRELAAEPGLAVAEIDGEPAGVIITSDRPTPYIEPAAEPELYVVLLLTSRAHAGNGVGRFLIDHAKRQAIQRGVDLMRVDCWAGGDGALARHYQKLGFTPAQRFTVGEWQGQVLEYRFGNVSH